MSLRKPDRRTLFYGLGIVIFVLAVLFKQADVRRARQAEIVSVLDEWYRDGKPVQTEIVLRRTVPRFVKITLQPLAPEQWRGYVTAEIQAQIEAGQEVVCEVSACRFAGTIVGVADTLSRESGLFAVDVEFDQPVPPTEPGLVAYIQVETHDEVLAVDARALDRDGGEGQFVWVVREDRAYPQPVVARYADGTVSIIDQGLAEHDAAVVAGRTQLQPGDRVQILAAPEGTGSQRMTP